MRWYLPLLLVCTAAFTGCGISPDEAAASMAKLQRNVEGLQQMLDNAAKMDGVRKDVAAITVEIMKEHEKSVSALADIAVFLSTVDPPPTIDDYKTAVARLNDANGSQVIIAELVKRIDDTFGETALPPDLQAELIRLRDSSQRLMERIKKAAEATAKAMAIVEKVGSAIIPIAGGASGGVGGIIASIVAGAGVIGAGALSLAGKKGGTS
jgi:hypothetical protein